MKIRALSILIIVSKESQGCPLLAKSFQKLLYCEDTTLEGSYMVRYPGFPLGPREKWCNNACKSLGARTANRISQVVAHVFQRLQNLEMADPGLRSYLYSQAEKSVEELLSKGCISSAGHGEILKILHQEQGGGQQMGYPAPYPGQYQQYPQNNGYMQPYQQSQPAQVQLVEMASVACKVQGLPRHHHRAENKLNKLHLNTGGSS